MAHRGAGAWTPAQDPRTEPLGRWDGSPGKAVQPSARTDSVMVFLPLGALCGFYRIPVLFSLLFLPSP